MECQRDPESIAAFVDGQLGPSERAELEAHLATCAGCRERVAAQRRLASLIAALPAVEPAPDFEARFWGRIAREREAAPPGLGARLRRLLSPRLALALGAAAAAAVALLVALPRAGAPPQSLPESDAPIVANGEDFQLVQDPDIDAIAVVDVLEDWDDAPPG